MVSDGGTKLDRECEHASRSTTLLMNFLRGSSTTPMIVVLPSISGHTADARHDGLDLVPRQDHNRKTIRTQRRNTVVLVGLLTDAHSIFHNKDAGGRQQSGMQRMEHTSGSRIVSSGSSASFGPCYSCKKNPSVWDILSLNIPPPPSLRR